MKGEGREERERERRERDGVKLREKGGSSNGCKVKG